VHQEQLTGLTSIAIEYGDVRSMHSEKLVATLAAQKVRKLTLQRGVLSLDRHKINITCRGVPSTARILRAHTSTAISRTFMKQMQSGFFCLVENEAGFLMTCNTVLKIDY
jgi:hypothetical protein